MSKLPSSLARQKALLKRRELSKTSRHRKSLRLCQRLLNDPTVISAKTIACYHAMHDEVDLSLLYSVAWQQNKTVLFPVVKKNRAMSFVKADKKTHWRRNALGVYEPIAATKHGHNQYANPHRIDIVIAPLSAFDAHFARVGMGGGYYDHYMSRPQYGLRPRFIGVAFDCQQTTAIQLHEHDVPLDAIATESQLRFRKRRR
ncbi:MAG: 5-formyltetrahydrofolate cyclo-ligase [Pseudomonadota bacterium]